MTYNPWPLGKVPIDWQRAELREVTELGTTYSDARELVSEFESRLADYAGSKYAITVDSASSGIFSCLKYLGYNGIIRIPRNTYISVPMQIVHAGCKVELTDLAWSGVYSLQPTRIFDSAARFTPGMYLKNNALQVLSFQIKKRLPIGKGGAILTDDLDAYKWLLRARYDGRDLESPYDDPKHVSQLGWHMYMTPEDAARGIILLSKLGNSSFEDVAGSSSYPDISNWLRSAGIEFDESYGESDSCEK